VYQKGGAACNSNYLGYNGAVLISKEARVEQDLAQIEQFLDALWLERNLAENTLSAYRGT
jgi:integrase/recombinase XerD